MQANDLNLSTHNPILIYSFLALYGLLTALILTYVHARFRAASNRLKMLASEWENAESRHAGCVGAAREQLSKLTASAAAGVLAVVPRSTVNPDVRDQVAAMAKRGIAATEIARSCGLSEGEVEVLLGIVRMQRDEWKEGAEQNSLASGAAP